MAIAERRATFLKTGSAEAGGKTGKLMVKVEVPEPRVTEENVGEEGGGVGLGSGGVFGIVEEVR